MDCCLTTYNNIEILDITKSIIIVQNTHSIGTYNLSRNTNTILSYIIDSRSVSKCNRREYKNTYNGFMHKLNKINKQR